MGLPKGHIRRRDIAVCSIMRVLTEVGYEGLADIERETFKLCRGDCFRCGHLEVRRVK